MNNESRFIARARKELLEKEDNLRMDLADESKRVGGSLLKGLKITAVVGGGLLLGYGAFRLLSSNEVVEGEKNKRKKKEEKLISRAGITSALMSIAARSIFNYIKCAGKDDSEKDI